MGRAIEVDKKIYDLERDIKQLKTAFKGLSSTVESLQDTAPSKKNIDIHEEVTSKTESIKESPVGEGFAHKDTKKAKKKELVKEEA